jgi:hypothetical protein
MTIRRHAMKKCRRIAILTGGGDCPGINAVIRAVTKKAILQYGMEVIGIEDGYHGVIHNRCRKLEYNDVSGILHWVEPYLAPQKQLIPTDMLLKRATK